MVVRGRHVPDESGTDHLSLSSVARRRRPKVIERRLDLVIKNLKTLLSQQIRILEFPFVEGKV